MPTTVEQRRELKTRTPQTRLQLIHTENCRALPDRGMLLARLPQGGIAAEIGAAFGDYTKHIFAQNKPRELYLLDSWDSARYVAGMEAIKRNFAAEIEAGRLHLRQGFSTDKLAEFPNEFFDWVYIDTNHSYGTTWKELQLCHECVKPDGRIAGHDFCTGNVIDPVPYGVIEACARFCVQYGWQYEYITLESHGHFSFCLKRLGPGAGPPDHPENAAP